MIELCHYVIAYFVHEDRREDLLHGDIIKVDVRQIYSKSPCMFIYFENKSYTSTDLSRLTLHVSHAQGDVTDTPYQGRQAGKLDIMREDGDSKLPCEFPAVYGSRECMLEASRLA